MKIIDGEITRVSHYIARTEDFQSAIVSQSLLPVIGVHADGDLVFTELSAPIFSIQASVLNPTFFIVRLQGLPPASELKLYLI